MNRGKRSPPLAAGGGLLAIRRKKTAPAEHDILQAFAIILREGGA